MTTFTANDGLWPQIVCDFTVEDAVEIIRLTQDYATEQEYHLPSFVDDRADYAWAWWPDPIGHQAFHFLSRHIGASLIFDSLKLGKQEEHQIPRAINPISWITWAEPHLAKKRNEVFRYVLHARRNWYSRTDDFTAFRAVLAYGINKGSSAAQRLNDCFEAAVAELAPLQTFALENPLAETAATIIHCGDYGRLWLQTRDNTVCWVAGDADDLEAGYTSEEEIRERFSRVNGVAEVQVLDEGSPVRISDTECEGWIFIPYQQSEQAQKEVERIHALGLIY